MTGEFYFVQEKLIDGCHSHFFKISKWKEDGISKKTLKSFELYDHGCLGCSNTSGLYVADAQHSNYMINKNTMLHVAMGYEIVLILKKCYEWVNQRTSTKCH